MHKPKVENEAAKPRAISAPKAKPAVKAHGVNVVEGELLSDEWNVPVLFHRTMQKHEDGVHIASINTFENKAGISRGSNKKIAMLVPFSIGIQATCVLALVWIGSGIKEATRPFVHLGQEQVVRVSSGSER